MLVFTAKVHIKDGKNKGKEKKERRRPKGSAIAIAALKGDTIVIAALKGDAQNYTRRKPTP